MVELKPGKGHLAPLQYANIVKVAFMFKTSTLLQAIVKDASQELIA